VPATESKPLLPALAAVVAEQGARISALEAELAELREQRKPKPRPPSPQDRRLLAEIVDVLADDQPFRTGELTDDVATAKAYGEALARLLPESPVDGCRIERLGQSGHRRWLVLGGPRRT
jgi:hypothetical protein